VSALLVAGFLVRECQKMDVKMKELVPCVFDLTRDCLNSKIGTTIGDQISLAHCNALGVLDVVCSN
jgi:hypothetical protein